MHLTVIAKSPVAGRVKTRLCPPCTPQQAAAIAEAALIESIEAALAVGAETHAEVVLLLDGDVPAWLGRDVRVVAQRGHGLAERLAHGFTDIGAGVIVGMETPHMMTELGRSLDALEAGVATIGLATDGGYWSIGLGAADAGRADQLITGVPMSVAHTGVAQIHRLHRNGCRVALLPMARDIDTFDDVRAIAMSTRPGLLADIARGIVAAVDAADRPVGV